MIYLLQHALMESAARSPAHEAVAFGDQSLTYGELEERSNQLAHALHANGCRRGDRIGLLCGKSSAALVGIHGILKAGGAYVPLDPGAPVDRLLYLLDDCGIECLVTTPEKSGLVRGIASENHSLRSVALLGESERPEFEGIPRTVTWQELAQQPAHAPENPCIETDLAYLLYTSGSTGKPKGVMISHLNALTFVRWGQDTFGVGEGDRLSNHAPLHFDLSIFDIFAGLLGGATVVPVPEPTAAFPVALAEWISDNRISIWYSVPSALSLLVRRGELARNSFPDLRTVLFAGEVFPVKYLRALMGEWSNSTFYNLYGPTETNVITYCRIESLPAERTEPVSIGKACANTEVIAVAEDGTEVTAPGQEGELYARGSCVAQGYWGDEEKTRRVFCSNPLRPDLEERVYRTGDLVTLDEDGNYIFLGRRDHMVKRRGYRIELGEVEAALYTHAAVREAVVVAEPDEDSGSRLTAFVVADLARGQGASELLAHLAGWVPKYMLPDEIVIRNSLPLTSTGKVDRRAFEASERNAQPRETLAGDPE